MKYKSVFISDLHLGSNGCQAEKLANFISEVECEKLYLVGDIIDGWRLSQRWYFPTSHLNVIRKIMTKARRGTDVFYIAGNHDEFLRTMIPLGLSFGRISVLNKMVHVSHGKSYLVVHGDMFDSLMAGRMKWLMHVGGYTYDFLIWVNRHMNRVRRLFGMKHWSLSKYLKHKTKRAMNFIQSYENAMADYCKRKGYDGIICGHIHTAEIKEINGVIYMNDGDWVESCTALVEHEDGRFEIICYNDNI